MPAVYIPAAHIAVVFTGEPAIVEAIIAGWPLALPLPDHITHRAADTLTARATDWPLSSVRANGERGRPKPVPLARNMHVNRDLGG
jgi:hypothetical protein